MVFQGKLFGGYVAPRNMKHFHNARNGIRLFYADITSHFLQNKNQLYSKSAFARKVCIKPYFNA